MVKKYSSDDYSDLESMFQTWGMSAPNPDFLPKTGFIKKGLAAGFMYLTDSKIAIIDNFVCNKDSDKMERKECLNTITEMLVNEAMSLGIKLLKCDSNNSEIKNMAIGWGGKEVGSFDVFVKEIG